MAPKHYSCCIYQLRAHCPRPSTAGGTNVMRTVFFARWGEALGEASPSARMGETCHETRKTLFNILDELEESLAEEPATIAGAIRQRYALYPAARAATEMLVYDWAARRQNKALFQYLGLESPDGRPTSYPITLGTPEDLDSRLEVARDFPVLKITCSENVALNVNKLKRLRTLTDKPLRIDGYGSWGFDDAQLMIRELADLNVQYLEQPLARHQVEQTARLRRECPLPILLDEDVLGVKDLEHVAQSCDGFVIKLMSCGGISEALRLIERGRQLGLTIALDSTIESSAGVTAAAHLASAVDHINLGRHLGLENDPIEGLTIDQGEIRLPRQPGLGLAIRKEYVDYFPA